jgi:hypothetical protein
VATNAEDVSVAASIAQARRSAEVLFGSAALHRERIAELIGLI